MPEAEKADYLWSGGKPHRCDPFFRSYAFERLVRAGWEEKQTSFEAFADMRPRLGRLASPLTLVFTKDDPVLADPDYAENHNVPKGIRDVMEFAAKQPRVRVFFPEFGSHHAYFLDTRFLRRLLAASLVRAE